MLYHIIDVMLLCKASRTCILFLMSVIFHLFHFLPNPPLSSKSSTFFQIFRGRNEEMSFFHFLPPVRKKVISSGRNSILMGAPSDLVFRLLYGSPPQVSFFPYYRGPPQISFFAYYVGAASG